MKTLSVATAAVTVLLALGLTGCGGAGAPKAGSSSTAGRSGVEQDQKDKELKYVQCLRQNGMKIADPVNGRYDIDNSDSKDPKIQAAVKACAKYAPAAEGDKPSATELDGMVKVAQCLRRKGIKVKDPTADRHTAVQVPAGTSPQQFEQAQKECQKETGQGR